MQDPVAELQAAGYTEVTPIGEGGFGIVYSAVDTSLGRRVAIKVARERLDDDADARFERERHALASIPSHPNIVTVYAVERTEEGKPYFTMEFAPGGDLGRRAGDMDWTAAWAIGVPLTGALETAHRAGVIHRDVKPENVLLDAYETPKMSDFGISKVSSSRSTTTFSLTASLSHVPPELLDGTSATAQSDVYSLASTLYALVAGSPPFRLGDQGVAFLINQIANETPASLRTHGVPDRAADQIAEALSKDPADRPSSALAFGEALRETLRNAGHTVPSPVVGAAPAEGSGLWVNSEAATGMGRTPRLVTPEEPAPEAGWRRHKVLVAAAVALAIVGIGAIALLSQGNGHTPTKLGSSAASSHHARVAGKKTAPSATTTSVTSGSTGVGSVGGLPGTSGGPSAAGAGGQAATAQGGSPSSTNRSVATPGTTGTSAPAQAANTSPPVLALQDQANNELDNVNVSLNATSPGGGPVSLRVTSALPNGLSASGNTISGTISASAVAQTTSYQSIQSKVFVIQVVAQDASGRQADGSFNWTVRDTYLPMPDYVGLGGYGDGGAPNIGTALEAPPRASFRSACDPGANGSTIWRQSIAPGTAYQWGSDSAVFWYGYDPSKAPAPGCDNVATGW